MTVTNESGGRLNAFANEPAIDVMPARNTVYKQSQLFVIIVSLALISIIGIYMVIK